MTHNILPTARPDRPGRTLQPARTAMQLALKDELRTFGFNLQRGAHWLVQDLGGSFVKQVEPRNEDGTLHKLHQLIDSTAHATFSTLQVAQQAAAVAVLPDAAYRTLHFELQPLGDYFLLQAGAKNPSQLFTDAFYWLLRHALAGKADSALIARQQAIDQAYWQVLEQHAALITRAQQAGAVPRDHAALCAAVLRALIAAQPVRDASLPPWAGQPAQQPDAPAACQNFSPWLSPSAWPKEATIPPPTSASACAWPGSSSPRACPCWKPQCTKPTTRNSPPNSHFYFATLDAPRVLSFFSCRHEPTRETLAVRRRPALVVGARRGP
jgi:hypothetical protein